jgi:Mg/Co/Ni transporter MgtE
LREAVRRQRSRLEEQARQARVMAWQQRFLAITDVSALDKDKTQQRLKALHQPPDEVRPEERAILQPIRMQLTAHLDQMSLDEIISRIEQLPVARQRQLLALLTERWGIE